MKADILALYETLNVKQVLEVEESLEANEVLLNFFQLLKGMKTLSPIKLIHKLFPDQVNETNQQAYLKKFYKIHKELKDEITKTVSLSLNNLNNQEKELLYAKNLIWAKSESLASKVLENLEPKLMEFENFELVTELITLQVYLIKRLAPFNHEGIKLLQEKMQLSLRYNRALEKIIYLQSGVVESPEELKRKGKSFQKILNEFPNSKRFRKMYHFYIINHKMIFSHIVNQEKHAIQRHLNNLNRLQTDHPEIPLDSLKANQEVFSCFKLSLLTFSFNLLIENFEECSLQLELRNKIRKANPAVYLPFSFGEIYHDYLCHLMTSEFDLASLKINEMELFLRLERNEKLLIHVDLQRSLILFLNEENKDYLKEKELLKKLVKYAGKDELKAIHNKIQEAIFYLYWSRKDYVSAKSVFVQENLGTYFQAYNISKDQMLQRMEVLIKDESISNAYLKVSKRDSAFGKSLKLRLNRV